MCWHKNIQIPLYIVTIAVRVAIGRRSESRGSSKKRIRDKAQTRHATNRCTMSQYIKYY